MEVRNPVVVVSMDVALALLLVTGLVMSIDRYVSRPAPGASPAAAEAEALAIPTTADLYPPRTARSFPRRCGLDAATLRRLAPAATEVSGKTGCSFTITPGSAGSGLRGVLRVSLKAGTLADAMKSYDLATGQGPARPSGRSGWQRVTGLGEEAAVRYSDGRAELRFRSGTVTAAVLYRITRVKGADARPLARRPAVNGVLRAGARAASAIGAEVEGPKVATPASGTADALPTPDPCELVGEAALRAAGVVPSSRRSSKAVAPHGNPTQGCRWASGAAENTTLRVSVSSFPESRLRSGAAAASREFAELYHDKRTSVAAFHALRSPGEKAMATYQDGDGVGRGEVMFTVRNVMITVSLQHPAGGPHVQAAALNRAHAVAEAAATALPK
ncbi:hypothetical protein [Nonomuraea sp. SYSU D8015]|uniref:hypothetical protein n=1 Tax=Nonomuraea sp. SYSU D8015 TaxID=2593644 RepID=UPI001660EB03|nr:hypothetical protein [Nonomuraea sp. SYSU D8015]